MQIKVSKEASRFLQEFKQECKLKRQIQFQELYDSRDVMAVLTRNVIWNIEFLNTYTDKEKDILGKYSSSLFTLNTFYTANKIIVGRSNRAKFRKSFY